MTSFPVEAVTPKAAPSPAHRGHGEAESAMGETTNYHAPQFAGNDAFVNKTLPDTGMGFRPTKRGPSTDDEHLWAIEKNSRQLACELRDDGAAGVELQVSRDGELLYGQRWATRALALKKAAAWKAQYLREGGVLIA
jgi:hypothetical protein